MKTYVDDKKCAQGYQKKPVWPTCGTCKHFTFEVTMIPGTFGGTYKHVSDKRCSIGGFP